MKSQKDIAIRLVNQKSTWKAKQISGVDFFENNYQNLQKLNKASKNM
jgi:hypothetical protein